MLTIKSKRLIIAVLIAAIGALAALVYPAGSLARVYLDITSFDTLMPMAVSDFTADPGLTDVIRSDLDFTHAIHVIDPESYLESPSAKFHGSNWLPLGAEAVLKGRVRFDPAFFIEEALYRYDA